MSGGRQRLVGGNRGGCGVRCSLTLSRGLLPWRVMPLRAPIPGPARRLWGRSGVPVAPPAGNAPLPGGAGAAGCSGAEPRGTEGRPLLPRSPRPGRTLPALQAVAECLVSLCQGLPRSAWALAIVSLRRSLRMWMT